MQTKHSYVEQLSTPLGMLQIRANQTGLTEVVFVDEPVVNNPNHITSAAKRQLEEYFAGTRKTFELELGAEGTLFQQLVWGKLCEIPYSETRSYVQVAEALDNAKAVRAVGAANGKNPIAIIVPCHRVIGANGSLTGYAGGLTRKKWLLDWEQQHQ